MNDPTELRAEAYDALRDNPQRFDTVMRYLFDPEGGNESLPEVRATVHRLATTAEQGDD